ncbi:MAG: hypothetical protein DRQ42_00475 [Gammaproteobacteria bacterium]|nr:MAG: hypothetical protein DRQ42_00475 [Gammaproteobacteria bacterium]
MNQLAEAVKISRAWMQTRMERQSFIRRMNQGIEGLIPHIVFYAMNPTFFLDKEVSKGNLNRTHKVVLILRARDLEHVFYIMQAEVWSPEGEASELIRGLGLYHTSMSVGDCVMQYPHKLYQVDSVGFKRM